MRVEILSQLFQVSVHATENDAHFSLSCPPDITEPEITRAIVDLVAIIKRGEKPYDQLNKKQRKTAADFIDRVAKSLLVSQSAIKSPLGPRAN